MILNYEDFCEKVGLLNEEELEKLGWDADNGNRICTSKLEELKKFVAKLNSIEGGPKYHIATEVDVDCLESEALDEYCAKQGIDPEDFEDEIRAYGTCIANEIVFVNRMDYFLCNGDDNPDIVCEEVEIIDDRTNNSVELIKEEN